MGLPFPTLIYEPCMDIFSRSVVINPLVSQPGVAPYGGRGIFDTNEMDIEADVEENTFYSSYRTELDILQMEFPVIPMQGDRVSIPEEDGVPGGEFLISDVSAKGNAGGEVTLVLKAVEEWRLVGYSYFLGDLDFARPNLAVTP